MTLSWQEIRSRATAFAKEYKTSTGEIQDYADFWTDFFNIFGVRRRSVASFQKAIHKINGNTGFIDLFWPGVLLVEHKSKGEDLDSASLQANDYLLSLDEDDRPRYIVVSDFENIRIYDFEGKDGEIEEHTFHLSELPSHIRLFGFIAGYEVRHYKEEDPVNKKAVRLVVQLYRALAEGNYPKEYLARLMVRFVFLFFADDAGIFPKRDIFHDYILYLTKENGEDLGAHLQQIFEVLETPEEERQKALSDDLKEFPYVNGTLFKDHIPLPSFNKEMRQEIVKAAQFDWGAVSPAIFGSMFQFVMDVDDEDIRHDFGAHYTSEKNILKVVDGLFLDDLKHELETSGNNPTKLNELWNRIAEMCLLDPACGCGNFLVVAYRELRQIEVEIIKRLYHEELKTGQEMLHLKIDVSKISKLTLAHLFGIEILSFPAEIARLSLWLIDHQMNVQLGNLFGEYFAKLPLKEQPFILQGDALSVDWGRLLPKGEQFTYILGNPPFIGSKLMSEEQRKQITDLFEDKAGSGILDYVTGWYQKAARYIQGTHIECAFVSTNSITQGEQVSLIWEDLISKLNISIHFAHRTFKWQNEAPGQAGVFCVIIGFAAFPVKECRLFDYENVRGEPHEIRVTHINPYLIEAPDVFISRRDKPISKVPEMTFGNMPLDGGFLLLDNAEKEELLRNEPEAEKFIKPLISAREFLNNGKRWCLWLVDAKPEELRKLPLIMQKIEGVRTFRGNSVAPSTRKFAATPSLFRDRNNPDSCIAIPRVSSETRHYIPMGFFDKTSIISDTMMAIPNGTLYNFGILESEMHMTWMRAVCGRLKSDYRYSKDIVYNNFIWPKEISEKEQITIDAAARAVLDARVEHPKSSLADLYDPNVMPPNLLEAHKNLDHAVDVAYGVPRGFPTEAGRLEFLFKLYEDHLRTVRK